jgi:AraC-like DNA-binding protein
VAIGPIYRPFLDLLRESGVDVDAALGLMHLSYAKLVDEGRRLNPDEGRAIGRLLLDRVGPDIGLRAAERFAPTDLDVMGYIMRHSAHPLAALEALAQHARVIGDSADFRLERTDDHVTLTLALQGDRQMLPPAADFAAAIVFKFVREATGGRVLAREVHLPRPQPRQAAPYTRYFGRAVIFGASAPSVVYARDELLLPFTARDRRLVGILQQHAERVVARLPPVDLWQARVRRQIAQGLQNGGSDLESVARRCGVGERTLRRRLAETGTSYRTLVDDVRHERALCLLSDLGNVSAVAQQVGFSDASAFARAFRRWTGRLPHEHLRALRADTPIAR